MKLKLVCLLAVLACSWAVPGARADDFMDVDVSQVDARFQKAFKNAESFWESRIVGYSSSLPRTVKAQLRKLRIIASSPMIDGAGGILGQAGPNAAFNVTLDAQGSGYFNSRLTRRIAIPQQSTMMFDIEDLPGLLATGSLDAVIRHEMAHAIGFGSLWAQNDAIAPVVNGLTNFVGKYALNAYRKESGNTLALFVPIEQGGGGGTALAHWEDDDPFFNKRTTTGMAEVMLGSIDPANDVTFVSETTWASFADIGYSVRGVNFVKGESRSDGVTIGVGTGTGWTTRQGTPIFAGFGGR